MQVHRDIWVKGTTKQVPSFIIDKGSKRGQAKDQLSKVKAEKEEFADFVL
jgi:hypothetical protein